MTENDPLTRREREEFENDLTAFCDRELDHLGDIRSLDVLYAGGSSPLWIEGLSQRIGENGTLISVDMNAERIDKAQGTLAEAGLVAPVRFHAGDIFAMPFGAGTFDLVYSSGRLHELDVKERSAGDALAAFRRVARPGGRVATGDFVDSAPALQLEDEELEAELRREVHGSEVYGIGPPARLVVLHEELFTRVRWRISPPQDIRHLGKLVLNEDDPPGLPSLPPATARRLRQRREALRGRISSEGYTRPATLYVEGHVRAG